MGEAKGGMISESSTETCVLPFVKEIASPSSTQQMGLAKPVHWDNPEGWDGEGGRFGMRDTCTPMADSCQCMAKPLQYCKVIILQFK